MGDDTVLFEANHGTAPRFAGMDMVNPGSLILSAALMLRHLGWHEAAGLVVSGLERTISQGIVTFDLASQSEGAREVKCSEFAQAIRERI